MRTRRSGAAALVCALMVACAGGEPEDADAASEPEQEEVAEAVSDAPRVDPKFQRYIDNAWQEASSGESPSSKCAALQGRAVPILNGTNEAEKEAVSEALDVCAVQAGSHYYLTLLDRIEAGERECATFVTDLTQIGALVMTVGEDDPGLSADRRERIEAAIKPRVEEVCPMFASAVG